jgi:hypothetical protein
MNATRRFRIAAIPADGVLPGRRSDKLVELRLFGANSIGPRCTKWSERKFPRQYRFADATRL